MGMPGFTASASLYKTRGALGDGTGARPSQSRSTTRSSSTWLRSISQLGKPRSFRRLGELVMQAEISC
jgi:hypothetical protein